MEARFRMRNGDFEIELEGERSFVEAQLAQHLDPWHALANGIASGAEDEDSHHDGDARRDPRSHGASGSGQGGGILATCQHVH